MPTLRSHSLLILLVAMAFAPLAHADRYQLGKPLPAAAEDAPEEIEGVEITEKLGTALPMDLLFRDATGAPVRLGDLFGDGKPVILTFNYSNCPMLCSVQLGGLVDALRQMQLTAGKEFRIVTVGLDPTETHERAFDTKLGYLERYGREGADLGWRFLGGHEASIRGLAEAVGFGYRRHPENGDYLHPAAFLVITPKGQVSTYVYGVSFDPKKLSALLATAAFGGTSESTEKFLLTCFHYEATEGAAGVAVKVMRYGGLTFVVGLIAAFGAFGAKRRRSRRTSSGE